MDALQDWPEPVVRVQSLSESGLTVIPDRYVKPSPLRPSADSDAVAGELGSSGHKLSIPVVDLGGLVEGAVECRATIAEIADACREWGFFQAVNHGVRPDLIEKVREVWRKFFHLPMEDKQVYANTPRDYQGYGSRLGVQKGASLDWGDYFFLHLFPESLKDPSRWPALPISCRETIEEYGDELMKLCETLMKVLSISLGLDVDHMEKAFGGREAGATLRANYYPKCPQPDLTLGLSPHSDPGAITILLADDRVKGLQVRKGDNAWVTVQPIPNAFIVNLGDQVEVLSNAIYKSVEHRVAVNAEEERISLAFFYNPKSDLPVGPASELVTAERPRMYQPMTYSEYRMYIRTKGPNGKAQVQSLKAIS